MIKKINFVLFIFLLTLTTKVYAHKPIFEGKDSNMNNVITVPDHKISYAVYGELKDKTDVDVISFKAKKGDTFFVEAAIPIIKGNEDFSPYFAIAGKGFIGNNDLPFDLTEGYGAITIPPSNPTYFHEKFTGTSYNIRQKIRGTIDEDGDYYVYVFSKDRGGKYSIAIGEKEKFNLLDIIKFPFTYLRVKFFFNPVKTVLISIALVIIIVSIIKIVKRRG